MTHFCTDTVGGGAGSRLRETRRGDARLRPTHAQAGCAPTGVRLHPPPSAALIRSSLHPRDTPTLFPQGSQALRLNCRSALVPRCLHAASPASRGLQHLRRPPGLAASAALPALRPLPGAPLLRPDRVPLFPLSGAPALRLPNAPGWVRAVSQGLPPRRHAQHRHTVLELWAYRPAARR